MKICDVLKKKEKNLYPDSIILTMKEKGVTWGWGWSETEKQCYECIWGKSSLKVIGKLKHIPWYGKSWTAERRVVRN